MKAKTNKEYLLATTMDSLAVDSIVKELNLWQQENKTQRLWDADPSLWTNQNENLWLGWLTVPEVEQHEIPSIEALKQDIQTMGFSYIVVLGMGGSSLCPAMLAKTFGKIAKNPTLLVLDSTDPMQIRHLEASIDLKNTIFIVSSKSGSTLEPNIFKQYFYSKLQKILGKEAVGDRFIAVTDPGSQLESIAKKEHFRAIFQGDPNIGGRYSALSNFGMLPAGLMGLNVKKFLQYADTMIQHCLPNIPVKDNSAVLLGVILGVSAKEGKDKVTLIVSPAIQALGAWLEQLLAESTGKNGKGLIPVDLEPLGSPDNYGNDRLFVYIRLEDTPDHEQDVRMKAIEDSGQRVVRLVLASIDQLAGELFRWEMATAVAGSIIGINPFDQPDVEGSKVLAAQLIAEYKKTNEIKKPQLLLSTDSMQFFTDDNNAKAIMAELKLELNSVEAKSKVASLQQGYQLLLKYLKAHFNRIKPGDYFNISAFIEMSDQHLELLQQCRLLIRNNKKIATCLGFGPRFLHSTGQAYKGGPNTGVFLQITAERPSEESHDLKIPGLDYSFGVVIDAQAEADFEVLAERDRRVLRVHLRTDVILGLKQLKQLIEDAVS